MVYSFIAAIAFLLILEGFIPFLSPVLYRLMVVVIARQNDRAIRIGGFVLIIVGLVLLVLSHRYLS